MARNTKHNIFTVRKVMILHVSVILFTGAGGLARRHPTWEDNPHPPGRQTPQPRLPDNRPGRKTPSRTATAADGMHPTGMHSCYFLWLGCCCSYIIDLESRVPKLVCCHEFMANTMNGWFGLVMFQFSRAFPHSDQKWDSPHAFMWFRGFHYNKSSLKINEWTSLYLQVSLG